MRGSPSVADLQATECVRARTVSTEEAGTKRMRLLHSRQSSSPRSATLPVQRVAPPVGPVLKLARNNLEIGVKKFIDQLHAAANIRRAVVDLCNDAPRAVLRPPVVRRLEASMERPSGKTPQSGG
jgi:hypothetical protein